MDIVASTRPMEWKIHVRSMTLKKSTWDLRFSKISEGHIAHQLMCRRELSFQKGSPLIQHHMHIHCESNHVGLKSDQ